MGEKQAVIERRHLSSLAPDDHLSASSQQMCLCEHSHCFRTGLKCPTGPASSRRKTKRKMMEGQPNSIGVQCDIDKHHRSDSTILQQESDGRTRQGYFAAGIKAQKRTTPTAMRNGPVSPPQCGSDFPYDQPPLFEIGIDRDFNLSDVEDVEYLGDIFDVDDMENSMENSLKAHPDNIPDPTPLPTVIDPSEVVEGRESLHLPPILEGYSLPDREATRPSVRIK